MCTHIIVLMSATELQKVSPPLPNPVQTPVVQMGKQGPRGVEWKWASWVGGGAAKFQGDVRDPADFPDRPLFRAIHLSTSSLQPFFPAQSHQDLSALTWSTPAPHVPQPLPPSLFQALSQKNHLRPQGCPGVPAPESRSVTLG